MSNVITIDLGTIEYYDGNINQFVYDKGGIVRFEYSLKAIYEWENKWRKPFLKGKLTERELIDFYMTMALDPVKEEFMTNEVVDRLSNYISDSNTATVFPSNQEGQNGNKQTSKFHTAEELYALMFMANIPIEFENRNLNRLLVILRIMNVYNAPPKKMAKSDIYRQNAQLNAARKKQLNTKG